MLISLRSFNSHSRKGPKDFYRGIVYIPAEWTISLLWKGQHFGGKNLYTLPMDQTQSLNTAVLCCFLNYLNIGVWPRNIQMIHKNMATTTHVCTTWTVMCIFQKQGHFFSFCLCVLLNSFNGPAPEKRWDGYARAQEVLSNYWTEITQTFRSQFLIGNCSPFPYGLFN